MYILDTYSEHNQSYYKIIVWSLYFSINFLYLICFTGHYTMSYRFSQFLSAAFFARIESIQIFSRQCTCTPNMHGNCCLAPIVFKIGRHTNMKHTHQNMSINITVNNRLLSAIRYFRTPKFFLFLLFLCLNLNLNSENHYCILCSPLEL